MSRIYFHTPSSTEAVEVSGRERAYMGLITGNLLIASIGTLSDYPSMPHWLRKLLPPNHWVLDSERGFEASCKTFIRLQSETEGFVYNNEIIPMFHLALNTALFSGDDPIKLLARIHGQCELNCYIVGKNRKWVADIIKKGHLYNIMRPDQGWEDVIAMLELRDDEPVVLSYSVCDGFPNRHYIPEEHEWQNDEDAYNAAPYSERWSVCFDYLYNNYPYLELRPNCWNTYYFGHGLSGFDLYDLAMNKYNQLPIDELFIEREDARIMAR